MASAIAPDSAIEPGVFFRPERLWITPGDNFSPPHEIMRELDGLAESKRYGTISTPYQ